MKPMTLHKLAEVLANLAGNGYPAVLQTPDGRRWEPAKVTNTRTIGVTEDKIETVVTLKEVTE